MEDMRRCVWFGSSHCHVPLLVAYIAVNVTILLQWLQLSAMLSCTVNVKVLS